MDKSDTPSIPPTDRNAGDDAELAQVMESYLASVDEGRTPPMEHLLAAHPRIAERLRACLMTLRFVESAASPIAAAPPGEIEAFPDMRLGDFRIIREVGRGGMGVVYEAEQVSLHRRVALKVLPFATVLDAKQIQRFKNEAQAAALLHHTNIVPVFSVGCERGVHYFAMQFIDGRTLAAVIEELRDEARKRSPSPEGKTGDTARLASPSTHRTRESFRSAAGLGLQAAEALAHAHELGIIHRDIKPSNLLLDARANLWVTDFGLARIQADSGLTLSGDVLGTLRYMSPEQALVRRGLVDHRTDIYSLGATFHELLTLEPAFRGVDRQEILRRIAFEDPRAPRRIDRSIPADLETIVLKAMAKDPADRYQTAKDLAGDLRRYIEDKPIAARRPALVSKIVRWSRRHKLLFTTAAAILVSFATLAVLIEKQLIEARARKVAYYEASLRRAMVNIELERPQTWMAESEIRGMEDGPWRRSIDGAVAAARECVALLPDRPDAYYHLARGLLLLERRDEAAEALLKGLEWDAEFLPARVLLAEVLGNEEEPGLPAPAPAWVRPWLEARRARHDLRWMDAIAAYGRLLHATAGLAEPYFGLVLEARLARGRMCLEMKDFDAALEDFAGANALWPELVEPVLLLGKTHCARGNLERAEARFEPLYQSPPWPSEAGIHPMSRDEIALAIASVYHDASAYRRALAWADRAGESVARERQRADLLLHLDQVDEALRASKRAVELDPRSYEARIEYGQALARKGRVREGVEEMRRAIELAPQLAWPHAALATEFQAEGDFDAAVRVLESSLRIAPRHPLLHIDLGKALESQGKLVEAIAAYRAALEVQPNQPKAHHNLALLFLRNGRPVEALAEIRSALVLEPRKAEYHAMLGWALDENGQFELGLAELRKGVELEPGGASVHHALAGGLLRRDLHREASREYIQALALDPGMSEPCMSLRSLLENYPGLVPDGDLERLAEVVDRALRGGVDHEPLWALVATLSRKLPAQEAESGARVASFTERLLNKKGRGDPAVLRVHAAATFRCGRKPEAIGALEEAIRLPDADRALAAELETYRRALLPDLATFGSIDAALASPEVLLPAGAVWRFLPGRAEPSQGLKWAEADFDDASWGEGAAGLGYGDDAAATVLADMRGSYTTVYARRAFEVADPANFKRFLLSVRVDDGFVAYLNGAEVGRLRAGKAGEPVPFNATADSWAEEPLVPHEVSLGVRLLRSGRNVLALQGLNQSSASSDFVLAPVLLAEPCAGFHRERVREFRAAAREEDASARLAYLDGRLLQLEGKHSQAAERFEEAAGKEPARPEPVLRIAECWKAAGDAARAEARARETLAKGMRESDELWDLWFGLTAVDLGRGRKEILASFPVAPDDAGKGAASRGADLRWAVEAIERDGRIRMDSGGEGYTSPSGAVWARDRFTTAGQRIQHLKDRTVAGTDDNALFQADLWFRPDTIRPPGYRIPLPPGSYRVTLHFTEVAFQEKGKRRFDVLLEGEAVLEGYEPLPGSAERKTFVKAVPDGFLDITFVHRVDSPVISALEVEWVD